MTTLIIRTMEVCQIFYDLSFTFFEAAHFKSLMLSIQFFGGLSVALWTNVLSIVLLHVVVNTQSIDILKYYWWLCLVTIGPAAALFCVYMALYKHSDYDQAVFKTYYGLRLMSIVINLSVFCLITFRNNITKSVTPGSATSAELAIRVLSRRVVYYPLLQAVTILPAVAYEYFYGLYDGLDMETRAQFVAACIYLLLAPSAGMGYLAVFLKMQPNAYRHFLINLRGTLSWLNCCCHKDRQLEDDTKLRVVNVLDNGLTTATSVGRLARMFAAAEGEESESARMGRFASMEEDELAREINRREAGQSTDTVSSSLHEEVEMRPSSSGRKSSVDNNRLRADHFSV